MAERLTRRGVPADEIDWDSAKRDDGLWRVKLGYVWNGHTRHAEWLFDPRRRHVSPHDDEAHRLSSADFDPDPVVEDTTVTPFAPRMAKLQPVPPLTSDPLPFPSVIRPGSQPEEPAVGYDPPARELPVDLPLSRLRPRPRPGAARPRRHPPRRPFPMAPGPRPVPPPQPFYAPRRRPRLPRPHSRSRPPPHRPTPGPGCGAGRRLTPRPERGTGRRPGPDPSNRLILRPEPHSGDRPRHDSSDRFTPGPERGVAAGASDGGSAAYGPVRPAGAHRRRSGGAVLLRRAHWLLPGDHAREHRARGVGSDRRVLGDRRAAFRS
ncbi:septation protein SepH [Nonomuraea ferruginea]